MTTKFGIPKVRKRGGYEPCWTIKEKVILWK
jgi:hypothetical protein